LNCRTEFIREGFCVVGKPSGLQKASSLLQQMRLDCRAEFIREGFCVVGEPSGLQA
jgi:hypothetical protein